jgi:hypothetical protein
LSVLVGVLLTIGLSARAETVNGTFKYRDSDRTLRPIISTRVEIWRHAPRFLGIWAWGADAAVPTNSNGSISVNMPFVASGVTYQVRVYAADAGAVVHQIQNLTADFYDVPSISFVANSPSNVFDFSFNIVDPYSAQHYNMADTVLLGFNYANSHRDPRETDPLHPTLVQPSTTLPTGTFYNPVNDALMIASSDVFNDYVILHEYAHYLEERTKRRPTRSSRGVRPTPALPHCSAKHATPVRRLAFGIASGALLPPGFAASEWRPGRKNERGSANRSSANRSVSTTLR